MERIYSHPIKLQESEKERTGEPVVCPICGQVLDDWEYDGSNRVLSAKPCKVYHPSSSIMRFKVSYSVPLRLDIYKYEEDGTIELILSYLNYKTGDTIQLQIQGPDEDLKRIQELTEVSTLNDWLITSSPLVKGDPLTFAPHPELVDFITKGLLEGRLKLELKDKEKAHVNLELGSTIGS